MLNVIMLVLVLRDWEDCIAASGTLLGGVSAVVSESLGAGVVACSGLIMFMVKYTGLVGVLFGGKDQAAAKKKAN